MNLTNNLSDQENAKNNSLSESERMNKSKIEYFKMELEKMQEIRVKNNATIERLSKSNRFMRSDNVVKNCKVKAALKYKQLMTKAIERETSKAEVLQKGLDMRKQGGKELTGIQKLTVSILI